jgi:hypothetical protein
MAKKNKETQQEGEVSAAPLNEYARELEYEKSLPKKERKIYKKAKRKQYLMEWVDKHWFPFLLFCALILMCSAITILLAVYNKL